MKITLGLHGDAGASDSGFSPHASIESRCLIDRARSATTDGKAKGSRVARRRRAPVRSAGRAARFFFAISPLHKARVAEPPEGNPAARSDPLASHRAGMSH
jgi:hypothetical protein